MKKNEQTIDNRGKLTLIGTPLGNLEDMSPRALRLIREVDLLLCEDTRRTSILLSHFKIERSGPTQSFHDHSPGSSLEKIKRSFKEGKHVGYVTDAGLPGVSDPGFVLVRLARAMGVHVSIVPGPSAATTFFSICGLPAPKFLFHGFFPQTKGEIEKIIQLIRELNMVHLFYEAPYRLVSTLEVIQRNLPEVQVSVGRELTKIHEEIVCDSIETALEHFQTQERVRGEIVFGILGGSVIDAEEKKQLSTQGSDFKNVKRDPFDKGAPRETVELTAEQMEELTVMMRAGLGSKEVAKQLSKKFGVGRRELYDFIVKRLT